MRKYIVLLLAVTMTACASSRGFDKGYLRSQIVDQKVVTEEDIKKALELKPQLPVPFKLAVFFSPPKYGWRYGTSWNWTGEDKDALIQVKTELMNKNIISDMFVLSDAILEGTDCVFRPNPATCSDTNRPLIPIESGHRFRPIPATF